MSSAVDITSSFIEGAPPGELADVVKDIKALTSDDDPALIAKLKPSFRKYNEDQMVAVKLPGASDYVCLPQNFLASFGKTIPENSLYCLRPILIICIVAGLDILVQLPSVRKPLLRHPILNVLRIRPDNLQT